MRYNTANVHRLHDFAQVKKWYTDTPPIRGNPNNIRPLGSRRHHYIANMVMPDDNTVDLCFYGKPFVRWHADDTFEVMCPTYYSAYAPDNITNFLPDTMRMSWGNTCMFLVYEGRSYLILPGEVFKFSKVGDKYFFLNKPVAYAYRKRRGVLKQVMKKYDAFRDWLTVVTAINNETPQEEEMHVNEMFSAAAGVVTHSQVEAEKAKRVKENSDYPFALAALAHHLWQAPYSNYRDAGFCTAHCAVLDKWIAGDNAEDWVNAMKVIALRYGRYVYGRHVYILEFGDADRVLREIASHLHRDEVFEIVRLPDGQVPSRTNANYFKSHELPTLAELPTFGR